MINNRQAGRRRGRGGQRQQGGGGGGRGPESGNRIDNRARGNANQLLEKYKNLASEAQRQGDRVNTEYYLQFADHYFRVLADNRARFEEQNQRRQGDDGYDGGEDDGSDFDSDGFDTPQQAQPRRQRDEGRSDRDEYRRDRDDRGERQARSDRDDRPREDRSREDRPQMDRQRDERPRGDRQRDAEAPANDVEEFAEAPRPTRGLRPRRAPRVQEEADTPVTLDLGALPPPIQLSVEGETASDDEAPAPRRRGRPRKTPPAGEQAAE